MIMNQFKIDQILEIMLYTDKYLMLFLELLLKLIDFKLVHDHLINLY